MQRIVIFASGSGSNAENLITYFKHTQTAIVTQVFCNSKKATVFDRCKRLEVPCTHFTRADFTVTNTVLDAVVAQADWVVLAGFLWKIPEKLIAAFPNKIINIHPALLPKYGGKGMYGMHVHQAVKDNKEIETGITIHLVNEQYDDGAILFQATTPVLPADTPDTIAAKIHVLEQTHFPRVVEETFQKTAIDG